MVFVIVNQDFQAPTVKFSYVKTTVITMENALMENVNATSATKETHAQKNTAMTIVQVMDIV
jgi:hypothetical protein